MADPGSVMFQFERKGVIFLPDTAPEPEDKKATPVEILEREERLMTALEAGAEDASEEDDGIEVLTAPSDLMKVRQALIDAGVFVSSAELKYVPTSTVPVEGDTAEKVEKLLDAVDDLDDVTAVFTNAE